MKQIGRLLVAGIVAVAMMGAAVAQDQPAPRPTHAFLVKFGLKDKEATKWDGSVSLSAGRVIKVEGWHFDKEDKALSASSWQASTRPKVQRKLRPDELARRGGRPLPPPPIIPNGVIITVAAPAEAVAEVKLAQGNFSVKLSDLAWGKRLAQLQGNASVERVTITERVTGEPRHEDWADAVIGSNGQLYVCYTSYADEADDVYLHSRLPTGRWWAEPVRLTTESGDNFEPQIAQDGRNNTWVVWSSQVDGNWDLYARRVSVAGRVGLGPVQRLTTDPGPDIYPDLASGPDGRLYLAWQGARDGQFDIFLKVLSDGAWSRDLQITADPANDWEPAVAVAPDGTAYVAWDSYRTGDYNIFMRSIQGDRTSAVLAITDSPAFQAHVSIAVDPRGRAWLAWDRSGTNWGKDQGFMWRQNKLGVGIGLHAGRFIEIACLDAADRKQPSLYVGEAFPQGQRNLNELPQIHFDGEGRLWLSYRRRSMKQQSAGGGSNRGTWNDYLAYWDGQKWAADIWVPHTAGRQDQRPCLAADSNGGFQIAWAADGRPFRNPRPVNNDVYVSSIVADPGPVSLPELAAYKPPEVTPKPPNHPNEDADVARCRDVRVTIGGKTYRLLRGDTHRHTDISADGSGDGSQWEMYRYALDACQLDWISIGDHDNGWGEGQEYSWWRTQKAADLFRISRVFTPLFGYERSNGWPHGHRNVTNPKRGSRVVPRLREGRRLSDDDTKNLYKELRKQGGITFSHTSGTDGMGTDWRDNDPEIEPVVEIFQGCRTSYEYPGAPLAATEDEPRLQAGGFAKAGYVWEAWAKGYRLGVIASSDHGSTHLSFASVWAEDFTREAIFEGMKARRTFGATDNIILKFNIGPHFMGEEFATRERPRLHVEILGTNELRRVDIIKNNQFIYDFDPEGKNVVFTHEDNDIEPGTSYYYVRVVQDDEQVAWSSPIWVNYEG